MTAELAETPCSVKGCAWPAACGGNPMRVNGRPVCSACALEHYGHRCPCGYVFDSIYEAYPSESPATLGEPRCIDCWVHRDAQ